MISTKIMKPIAVIMILLLVQVELLAAFPGDEDGQPSEPPVTTPKVNFSMQQATAGRSVFVPGDGLFISTFPDTASFLAGPHPIDNNGMVEFPMIGKINVTGMNETQLSNFLKDKFKGYLRFPNINVKPMIRISVLGGVPRPGLFYVDYDQSLWEVLYYVGGTISEDGIKEMRLERDTDVVFDNLIPFYEKGVSLRNIGVHSGDQLWVPSPDRPSVWDDIRDIMPLVTFMTSMFFFYLSYQQQLQAARTR